MIMDGVMQEDIRSICSTLQQAGRGLGDAEEEDVLCVSLETEEGGESVSLSRMQRRMVDTVEWICVWRGSVMSIYCVVYIIYLYCKIAY